MTRLRLVYALAFACAASCARSIDGPQPQVSMVAPEAACNDQISTLIAISGQGLSPLDDENLNTSQLELPQISLSRVSDLDGAATSDAPITVPNNFQNPAAGDEQWTTQMSMAFTLCPPGVCSMQVPPLTDYAAPIAPGLYTITAKNRNGKSADLPKVLTIVPVPALTRVDADLLCEDDDNTVTLTGDWFIRVNGNLIGTLTVGTDAATSKIFPLAAADGCRTLPSAPDLKIEACTSATARIPSGSFLQGTYFISATGPTPVGCHSVQDPAHPVTLTFVREPKLATVTPDVICDAQSDRSLVLAGADFLQIDGKLPTVHVGNKVYTATSIANCAPITGPGLREVVQQCATLNLTIAKADLDAANYSVTVTNPPPADCTTHPAIDLTVVPPPVITSIAPDFACDGVDQTFVLTGTGFVTIRSNAGGAALTPTVTFAQGASTIMVVSATPVAGKCMAVTGPMNETVQSCTEMAVIIPKAMTLAPGTYEVTLTNPDPAGCSSTQTVSVLIVAPPTLISIKPPTVCSAATSATPTTFTGTNFLRVNGTAPTVILRPTGTMQPGAAVITIQPPAVSAVDSTCVVLGQPPAIADKVESCTQLSVLVPTGVLLNQVYDVSVLNPAAAGSTACQTQEVVTLTGAPPPTLTGASPTTLCTGGGQLALSGMNLQPGSQVTVGALAATAVSGTGCGPNVAGINECTGLNATFGFGLAAGGPYDLTVSSGDGCSSTLPAKISVTAGALALFVDPPVVYNGIPTTVTVYASGVNTAINSVTFFPTGTSPTNPAAIKYPGAFGAIQPVGASNNKVRVTLPTVTADPTFTAGSWDVQLTDAATGCPALLANAIQVVSAVGPSTICSVAPSFGAVGADVPVTVALPKMGTQCGSATASSDEPVAANTTVRLYLFPMTAAAGATATPLNGVVEIDPFTVSAVVPKNSLTAGTTYRLYMLETTGSGTTIRVLDNAYTATLTFPPVITALSPSSVITSQATTFNVIGTSFDANATVKLTCSGGTVPTTTSFTSNTVNCDGASPPNCTIPINDTFAGAGTCVVRVTNPNNGAFFDFGLLNVENPASKLPGFCTDTTNGCSYNLPTLTVGRRAAGTVFGNVDSATRFLYAIGGDNGATLSADAAGQVFATVETAAVSSTGVAQPFRVIPANDMSNPIALAQATSLAGAVSIGRYLYVVGGTNTDATNSATTAVQKALLLNRTEVPNIDTVDVNPDAGSAGLAGGTWIYRVSAVMKKGGVFNVAGTETLGGEYFTIILPSLVSKIGKGLDVTISIDPSAIPGGAGAVDHYLVFRNPDQTNTQSGSEVQIGSTTSLSFVDDGKPASAPLHRPLPLGSTGQWELLGTTLNTARMGAGVAALPDAGKANQLFLYAVGGNKGTEAAPSVLNDYEYTTVQIAGDGSQSNSTWTAPVVLDATLSVPGTSTGPATARWLAQAFPVVFTYSRGGVAGSTSYLYYGTGLGGAGAVGDVEGAAVTPTGSGTAGVLKQVTALKSGGAGGLNGYAGAVSPLFATAPSCAAGNCVVTNNVAGFLFFISGASAAGTLGAGSNQAQIAPPASLPQTGDPNPPTFSSVSSTASNVITARMLSGAVNDGGYIFLIGGANSAGTSAAKAGSALSTVELTLF